MSIDLNFPRTLETVIRLDDDPRYKGSIHDDAVARAKGYRAALIPGAFVYGLVSNLAVDAWGLDWVEGGAMACRFRRPVYNGDRLVLRASDLGGAGELNRSEVTVQNQLGEPVATGWIAMPSSRAAPPIEALPVLEPADDKIAVAPGGMTVDLPVRTRKAVLTPGILEKSRAAFNERSPLLLDHDLAHSGCLMRWAMAETNSGFAFPAPIVLTEAEGQHYSAVKAGEELAVSARIVETFERNGRHYFVSEEHVIASATRVAARFRRTTLYG